MLLPTPALPWDSLSITRGLCSSPCAMVAGVRFCMSPKLLVEIPRPGHISSGVSTTWGKPEG